MSLVAIAAFAGFENNSVTNLQPFAGTMERHTGIERGSLKVADYVAHRASPMRLMFSLGSGPIANSHNASFGIVGWWALWQLIPAKGSLHEVYIGLRT